MQKHVLIVDNNYGVRMLLKEVLCGEGCRLYYASSAVEVFSVINEILLDLVLLDLKIPGADGVEVLKSIRKCQPEAKVMIITAYTELAIMQEVKKIGILSHFSKPFDINELRTEVNRQLAG